jgi:protein disulfide-isomerase A1
LFFVSFLVVFAEEASDVLELEDSNIEEAIANNEHIFIEFYAPWCGHCKRLAPDYELVASHFKGEGKVVIAKIDASTHTTSAGTHGIRGFPTLKLFSNGVAKDYEGERTSPAMIQWIKKKTGPATKQIASQEERDALFSEPAIRVVAHIAAGSDHETVWNQVAKSGKLEDFELAHITEESIFAGQKKDSVVIFKFDEEPIVYSGDFTEEGITTFVLSEGYPLIDELNQKSWTRSGGSQQPLLAVFVTEYNDDSFNFVKDIARNFKGKVITTYSNSPQLAERWGASGKVIPTAILVKWVGEQPKFTIYAEDGEALSVDSAVSFVTQSLEGTYTSFKKSEPIPESNDEAVKVLVGKNFESIVFDKEKDVFVEFYAPWCGHCKKLAPVWDELGEVFVDKAPNVVIAKIDATANSLPDGIEIQGFPTLIFFPADNKQGVPYNADRDLESLKQFVISTASRPISEKEDL